MTWQPFALAIVGLTLLAALLLTLRDFLRSPIESTYVRWGSLVFAIGLGLFIVAWGRGDSMLFGDLFLAAGAVLLVVSRLRGERQPDRRFRRRVKS